MIPPSLPRECNPRPTRIVNSRTLSLGSSAGCFTLSKLPRSLQQYSMARLFEGFDQIPAGFVVVSGATELSRIALDDVRTELMLADQEGESIAKTGLAVPKRIPTYSHNPPHAGGMAAFPPFVLPPIQRISQPLVL